MVIACALCGRTLTLTRIPTFTLTLSYSHCHRHRRRHLHPNPRQDEADDNDFYDQPRFCYHVDDAAVAALTKHYSTAFREWEKPAILDICASHVSHFPPDVADYAGRRVALGMNVLELSQNKEVTEFVAKDLNEDPTLPFEDNSFDIVTNVVSIDYLTQPLQVCKEVARVLKPGGQAMFSLSNRCFPSKAVNVWLKTNDLEHVYIVGKIVSKHVRK